MQDLKDNERKKQLKMTASRSILDFIPANFVMSYHCVSPYILFYIHGPVILLFLSYV